MPAAELILPAADPLGIPAPPALLQFLLVFTYILHVLFVSTLVGGGTLVAVAAWRQARAGDRELGALVEHGAQALPVAMAFSITTGVAPLLFVQLLYGQFFYTSSVFIAWAWISVVSVLIAGYYALYYASMRRSGAAGTLRPWALGFTLLTLAWVAFVMVNNMSLYPHPERFAALFNTAGTALNAGEPTLPARYVHALLQFLVVGASYVLAVTHLVVRPRNPAGAERLGSFAWRWLAGALVAQAVVSLWYQRTLPATVTGHFGGLENGLMVAAAVIGLLMALSWWMAGRSSRPATWAGAGALLTVGMVALLAVLRHQVRTLSLQPALDPAAWNLAPQWPQFILFVLLLLVGLGYLVYLLLKYPWAAAAPGEVPGPSSGARPAR